MALPLLGQAAGDAAGSGREQLTRQGLNRTGFYGSGLLVVFNYDPTQFTFLITAPMFARLLAFNGLCDPLPIARRALLNVLKDAVLILDNDGRIVELNEAAKQLPGILPYPNGALISSLTGRYENFVRAIDYPHE